MVEQIKKTFFFLKADTCLPLFRTFGGYKQIWKPWFCNVRYKIWLSSFKGQLRLTKAFLKLKRWVLCKWWYSVYPGDSLYSKCRIAYILGMDCGLLSPPEHGWMFGSKTTHPHNVSFTCRTGYRLVGPTQRTCLRNGSWSGYQPKCLGKVTYFKRW